MKKMIALLLCLCLAAGLTACQTVTGEQSDTGVTAQNAAATEKTESPGAAADESIYDLEFTKKDTDGAFDAAEAARIVFENGGASVTGDGVSAEGSLVTVTAAGTYIFSGETSEDWVETLWSELQPLLRRAGHTVIVSADVSADGADYGEGTEEYRRVLASLACRLCAERRRSLTEQRMRIVRRIVSSPAGLERVTTPAGRTR